MNSSVKDIWTKIRTKWCAFFQSMMLKKENATHPDLSICPICFEQLSNPHFYVPCRHIFCYKCISAWESDTCPLCRENVASCQKVKTAPSIGDDSTGNSEKSKLFSLVLVMTFLLVDFQSSSGFVQCVMYPASRDMCLAVLEVLYIVALIIYMPVKCFYRLVVEILIYELYDTFLALFSMPVNIGKILLFSPSYLYEGFREFFFNNSWAGLFQRTVHIALIMYFLASAFRTDWLKLKFRLRKEVNNVIERFKKKTE